MTNTETTKAKVIITGKTLYCVEVIQGDTTETVWGDGLLEDAIITAQAEAEERGASNVEAWTEFHAKHVCAAHDDHYMDYVERMILHKESCLDSRWGFDPAEASKLAADATWETVDGPGGDSQSYWLGGDEVRVLFSFGYDPTPHYVEVNGEHEPAYDLEIGGVDVSNPDEYTKAIEAILVRIGGVGF